MKKYRFLLVALTMLLMHCINATAASSFEASGLTYWVLDSSNKYVSVYSGKQASGNVVIPSTITDSGITYSVRSIGSEAFIGNKNISSVSIPNTVTSIGSMAFTNCINLSKITIPNSVTSIGMEAFNGCESIQTVDIGSGVTTIGEDAFLYCTSLTSFSVDNTNTSFSSENGVLFNKAKTKLIAYPGGREGAYTIPNGVQSVKGFSSNTKITSIEIPSSVTSIEYGAFYYCSNLSSITCHATTPPNISDCFYMISSSAKLYVPANSVDAYKSANIWNKIKTIESIKIPVSLISLDITTCTLWVNGTKQINATVSPIDASNKNVKWTSSNTSIATVSSTGLITAKGKGSTYITCTSEDNSDKITSCYVTVKQQITSITLNKTSITLERGTTTSLTATATPSTANTKAVTWSSSNTSVATVSSTGVVTAIKPGTATITCTASDGYGTKATCAVTVGAPSNVQIVDLGLPSCTQWASINIGASSESAYGNYYAWGETNVKSTYSKVNYTLASGMTTEDQWGSTKMTKYTATDGKKTLEASDDAAIANWGSAWVTPTTTQYQELIDNCTWTIENGAYRVTGPNGKSILLPFAGCRYDGNGYSGTHSATTDGYYMAKSVNTSNYGNGDILSIATKNNYKSVSNFSRFYGISVRPVSTTKATHTKVTAITISGTASIFVGKTTSLTATITPTNATDKRVAWKSSNTAVATVNENGVVTGVAKGTATITATAKDGSGISKTYSITVKQQVTSISLNKTTLALTKGATSTLTATVTPSTASNTGVTWSSSNTAVATVSTAGVVTAVANGSATITCTASDGYGTKTTCNVTVTNPVTSISLNATSATLKVNETKTLTVTYNPTDADNQSVTWSSSNTSVATVSTSGLVTAKGKGTATITCTSTDNSTIKATCAITVKQQVTSVTLSKTALNIVAGKTATLTATAAPSTANNTAVNWSSSNTKVATVSGGTITAVAAGTATITATAADGYGTKSTCTVTVIARGDVDGSGTIDNADITADVKFVMGDTDVTGLYADAADYNNNGKVTSTDAIAIVRLALTQTTTISGAKAKGMNANTTSKLLAVDDINMVSGESKEVSIRLADNMDKFTNIMFDVALPEGITIENVSVGSRATDHSAVYSLREDGTVRIICYSLSNDLFTASDGDIVKLKLKADSGVFDGTYDIDFTNIKLARKDVSSVTNNYETTSLNIGNTTGIGSVNVGDGKISASFKNGTLTITANEDGMASIYAVSGALVYKNKLKAGEKVTISVPRGVYIINGTKTSIK